MILLGLKSSLTACETGWQGLIKTKTLFGVKPLSRTRIRTKSLGRVLTMVTRKVCCIQGGPASFSPSDWVRWRLRSSGGRVGTEPARWRNSPSRHPSSREATWHDSSAVVRAAGARLLTVGLPDRRDGGVRPNGEMLLRELLLLLPCIVTQL